MMVSELRRAAVEHRLLHTTCFVHVCAHSCGYQHTSELGRSPTTEGAGWGWGALKAPPLDKELLLSDCC